LITDYSHMASAVVDGGVEDDSFLLEVADFSETDISSNTAAPGSHVSQPMTTPVTNQSTPNFTSDLDEPVFVSVKRDLARIWSKMAVVLDPRPLFRRASDAEGEKENQEKLRRELRDWDLWGPLLMCITLATVQSASAPTHQASLVFASIFFLVWVGGASVTLNAQLLKTELSFFQSICLLGYCVFPLTFAALIVSFIGIFAVRAAVLCLALTWATRASSVFLASLTRPERQGLVLYPLFLFYLVLSLMILVQ